jgi:hypothetical protein
MKRAAAALLLAAALAGCAPAPRAPLESMSGLTDGELVLVGRVELVPPLRKGEQKIAGNVIGGNFENRIFLMADERLRDLPRDPAIADYAGRIEAPIGSTFFVRSQARPFYILGGVLFLEVGGSSMQRIYFPGGLRVEPVPGAKAAYIGTLRYHRDEFFEITRVQVVDDYVAARSEFNQRFGAGQALSRALMTRVAR